tara:strand:+ start:2970 stop:3599 length:630 start_codon:yes stop_codon:yes gene_type:complete
MIIPRKDKKRIIKEFVSEIMNKLKVPDEDWEIRYTESLNHPTADVTMGNPNDWRYRDMGEAIKYAYLKNYIKTDIVQVPQGGMMKTWLDRSSTNVVSNWSNDDNDWILIYLAEREGIDFWIREDGADLEGGDNKYLIYKVIKFNNTYYIAVLNTQGAKWRTDMWCNLYPAKTSIYPKGNATIPIVITPLSRSKLSSFMNWEKEPWRDVK